MLFAYRMKDEAYVDKVEGIIEDMQAQAAEEENEEVVEALQTVEEFVFSHTPRFHQGETA